MVLEAAWIFLLLFLFAGSPPPDAGESHYLVKARHYWSPEFCRGDLFVESADAHLAFYWISGWLTCFFSLETTAWIGRILAWGAFAIGWQRLSAAILPGRFWSILSAGLMLALLRGCNMSRELILVGGIEGKVFAYVFILFALGELVRGRWNTAWILTGLATAMHVIVGGWAGVALAIAWLASPGDRPQFSSILPGIATAGIFALGGLIPGILLTWGQDVATVREAHRIYVFERLGHHLVFHRFGALVIARHLALMLVWACLVYPYWKKPVTLSGVNLAGARLQRLILGAVAISLLGIAIDQTLVGWATLSGLTEEAYQTLAAPLLRYYFFRLSDALLPMGVSLAWLALMLRIKSTRPGWSAAGIVVALILAGLNLGEICYDGILRPLPGAWLQPHPTQDSKLRAWQLPDESGKRQLETGREQFEDWLAVCDWIRENTPPRAKFLTPRRQQTFRWYAHRAEVVTWKDLPQDAQSVVAWHTAIKDLFPTEGGGGDLDFHSDADLVNLANQYGASYIVMQRTPATRPVRLQRVYPDVADENRSYAVYQVPQIVDSPQK